MYVTGKEIFDDASQIKTAFPLSPHQCHWFVEETVLVSVLRELSGWSSLFNSENEPSIKAFCF